MKATRGSGTFEWSCIALAATGNYTGELGEWPYLRQALRNAGHPLPPDTPAAEVITLCRQLLDEEERA